jgi:hypothetical protein
LSKNCSKRRARREKEAALEQAERLRGELSAFKDLYSSLQQELKVRDWAR